MNKYKKLIRFAVLLFLVPLFLEFSKVHATDFAPWVISLHEEFKIRFFDYYIHDKQRKKIIDRTKFYQADNFCSSPLEPRQAMMIAFFESPNKPTIYFCRHTLNGILYWLEEFGLAEEDIKNFIKNVFLHEYLHLFGYKHGKQMVDEQKRITQDWKWFENVLDVSNEDNSSVHFSPAFIEKLKSSLLLKFPTLSNDDAEVILKVVIGI